MKIVYVCTQCGAEIGKKRAQTWGHCTVCSLIAAQEFLCRVRLREPEKPRGWV